MLQLLQPIILINCSFSGTCLKTLVGHNGAVTAVQFNLDGTLIISCSYDGKCCVWDVLSGCCLKSILSNESSHVHISHARLSPNGKYLLMSTLDSRIRLWDYKMGQGRVLKTYQGKLILYYCICLVFNSPLLGTSLIGLDMIVQLKHGDPGTWHGCCNS